MVAGSIIAVMFALFGVVTTVLVLVLGALGIVKVDQLRRALPERSDRTGASTQPAPGPEPETDPVETLRERYAEGELTDEQFERKVNRLLETEGNGDETRNPALDLE